MQGMKKISKQENLNFHPITGKTKKVPIIITTVLSPTRPKVKTKKITRYEK